ncbi:MAG: 2-C-methyl-D-erythritol 4-phosphate cytidylyltransferase [Bacteroidetes bacterium]|nr:2-C-methyl-D-erythritol 4-phosphate cytidylyltransferase [Bacteroidota bacterium]
MKKIVLITSGGSGSRTNLNIPKQFVELKGKPLLMYSFNTFLKYSPDIEFVLVLADNQISDWAKLCEKQQFNINHKVVAGGPTRFHSVKNGLKLVEKGVLVAIHDGARPLVSLETISRVFNFAERYGNAIPSIDIAESVRMVENVHNSPIERTKLKIIQTPQCFKSDIIKDAYNQNYDEKFTDDATVLESRGHKIFLTEGNPENIKITTAIDFKIAETLLPKLKN